MIYLSICIPTFNRAEYLGATIESIISQPEFANLNEVEIVVSDNCSTDNTRELMEHYLNLYPQQIKYSRNNENIKDCNYEKVLSLGSGAMLKLNNDTLLMDQGSLGEVIQIVKYCLENDLIPFLLNGKMEKYRANVICKDEVSFLSMVSFHCTWIGGFFISKKEFKKINDFSCMASLMLTHVNVLFSLLSKNNKFLVVPDKFFTSVNPSNKGGYNLPKIFLTNYFQILKPYFLNKKGIKAFEIEKLKILNEFVLPWTANLKFESYKNPAKYSFDLSDYQETIRREFSYIVYLKAYLNLSIRVMFLVTKSKMKLSK